jgi:predicted AlkP superfamily pyrophosphatase or phosphodiesterase
MLPFTGLRTWIFPLLAAVLLVTGRDTRAMSPDTRILVVVLDGFRSDYFTPELMPRSYAAALQGVIGKAHHAVLPTVTRVNASTLVTGCQPARHGLVANTLHVPELNPTGGVSTGSRQKLLAVAKAWGGRLLATPTLAELLADRGGQFLVCSSGSSGSATLLNPTGAGAGILHPDFRVPEDRTAQMYERIGPKPPETKPARALMEWMTDAYLKIGVPECDPLVAFLWFTDPDHTSHENGLGAPEALEGMRFADEQIGRILDFHKARGMKVNVFIVADHGFASYNGHFDVEATLRAKGWMQRARPVVIDGAIYLTKDNGQHLAAIVRALQEDASIGPIFTPAKSKGGWKGVAPGTLSHELAGGGHPHGAQIIAYPNWNNDRNTAGYPGAVQTGGVAGHGATSPWEINAVFAAFGPDIKAGICSQAPTSNADIAPTIAFLTGIPIPKTMDGRVLHEVLKSGPSPEKLDVRRKTWTARSADSSYTVSLEASLVGRHRYVNAAQATRK